MAKKTWKQHDPRKAYKYRVVTMNFEYYFKRKADANKLRKARADICKRLFLCVLEHMNTISIAYVKKSALLGLNVTKDFGLLTNQVVLLAHYPSSRDDFERKVHLVVVTALHLCEVCECKRIRKDLQKMYDLAFTAPASFYAISQYIIIPKY